MSYPQQFPAQPEPAMPYGAPTGPVRRPGTVTAACVMTWIFSGIALLLSGWMMVGMMVSRDDVVAEIEKNEDFQDLDIAAGSLADSMLAISVVAVVLSLLAMLFAIMAFKGSSGGRIMLVITAALGAIFALLLSVALVPFLWVIVCVASIVLLFVGGAGPWYASKKR